MNVLPPALLSLILTLLFLPVQAVAESAAPSSPKVVLLLIGDGLGQQQLDMSRDRLRESNPEATLAMDALPVRSQMDCRLHKKYTTDSAASGTALACGEAYHMGAISVGQDKQKPLSTVVDAAQARGWKSGIISSVSLDHATPACFYAHEASRNNYLNIAEQIFDSQVDFFGGGGIRGLQPEGTERWRTRFSDAGYALIQSPASLKKQPPGSKVVAINPRLDASAALPDADTLKDEDLQLDLLLDEALRILDNQEGIFIMLEEGKLDWAGHAQNKELTIAQTLAFDRAVAVALRFAKSRPEEVLLIVTSDHETGGLQKMAAGYSFSHGRHSNQMVPLLSMGPGSEQFSVEMHNVEFGKRLKTILEAKAP